MTHRYLPWVRRGLAGAVVTPDADPADPDADIPELAEFTVGVTVNGNRIDRRLRMHGPASVTGIDTRAIIRHDPERFVSDFEPNNLVSLELDLPDFPWMFTPAGASANRLRPWLVLVVVEQQPGVSVTVPAGSPLPMLKITAPALPERELPPLAESWAWAHAQVITESDDIEAIEREVTDGHDLNLSRLICPRRLEGNRRYSACLVPAFEAGRRAGLGLAEPAGLKLFPAWRPQPQLDADPPIDDADPGGTVTLPVYYHWEFGTSHGGSDFEDLVDRIEPVALDEAAGSVPMYVGDPGQGIRPLPRGESVLGLEGALRPISPDRPTLDDVPSALQEQLRSRINAAASHLANGTPEDAAPLAPPIYGSYHAATHEVDAPSDPRWLEGLNLDPRLRTIAGVGASIVREKQEELMDEAWAQVGDVLTANQLLNQAALSRAAARRAYDRHLEPLPDDRLFTVTAPAHRRTRAGDGTVRRTLEQSRIPNAMTDPAFRRVASPQSRVLKRAARRGGATLGSDASVDSNMLAELDRGTLVLDDLQAVPDGIDTARALDHVDTSGPAVDMSPIGGVGSVPVALVTSTASQFGSLTGPPVEQLAPRADLSDSGLVTEQHLAAAAAMIGGEKGQLVAEIGEAIGALRPTGDTIGLQLVLRNGQIVAELVSEGGGPGPRRDPGRDPGGGGDGGGVPLPPPDRSGALLGAFGQELAEFGRSFMPDDDEPARPPLGLGGQRGPLLAANDPAVVTVRRIDQMVDRANWPYDQPLDPIMVGPRFDAALQSALAERSKELFLPGLGQMPPNSVSLAETNSRFIEAFMVGANHEMNHELQWRQYPTDRRGTPFRRFWDRLDGLDDIDPIHLWRNDSPIGENMLGGAAGWVVLLIRAELLHHYPNTIIYAAPALSPSLELDQSQGSRKDPSMIGHLEPDITFVMFPMSRSDLVAGNGHYIVFQEQPTELQLGLDAPSSTEPDPLTLTTWNDLTWGHVGVAPGDHLVLTGSALAGHQAEGAEFARTSADMAKIVLQRPVMVAYHANALIGGLP